MTSIYITEPGTYLHRKGGKLLIDKNKKTVMEVPMEMVEDITIMDTVQISSSLIAECFAREIPVAWLSSAGYLQGTLTSYDAVDIVKQRQQFALLEQKRFYFKIAQQVISAKVHNQLTLLKRYNRTIKSAKAAEMAEYIVEMRKNIRCSADNYELMGYEGFMSKSYFAGLGSLVKEPFSFTSRSKRPPRNPFNSMLSFGYSMLFHEVLNGIVLTGLHPYVGFLHQPAKGHPALASDLMEEWRAVIVDALVMSLISRGTVKPSMFITKSDGCFFTPEGRKVFLSAYSQKLRTENKYADTKRSFRESIQHQCRLYTSAVMHKKAEMYAPLKIR